MRTRSAEKKSAGKQQSPTGAASPPAAEPAVQPKRTPPFRAKQTKTVGSSTSTAAEEAKAPDADGAIQSTPEAKPPSGRKTTRKVVRKVVKKTPASSKTASDKTPKSENVATSMLEDPVEEKDVEDSKEDPFKEKDAADLKESKDAGTTMVEDPAKEKDADDSKEVPVKQKDAAVSEESNDAGTVMLEDPVKEKGADDAKENPVKEKDVAISKGSKDAGTAVLEDPVKEKDTEDSKEDPVKEKDAASLTESVKEEDIEDAKEDHVNEEDAEESKEEAAKEEGTVGSKEDISMVEVAQDPKEDATKEEVAEDSKEDIAMTEDVEDPKKDAAKEKGAEDVREDIVKMEDAEDSKDVLVKEEDAKESKEEAADGSKQDVVMVKDAEDSKEDPLKEKYAEDLKDAGATPMYESDPEEIEDPSNNSVPAAQNIGNSVMEDQSGNKEEHSGDAQEEPAKKTLLSEDKVTIVNDVKSSVEIGNDVSTSESQGPITPDVKSEHLIVEDMKSSDNQELVTTELKSQEGEGSIKAQEESESRGEKDNDSTPTVDNVEAKSAEDRMEEDTNKKMKGKDISLDEAGEDKIEAFADGEEFEEDDVSEHCEEAETLEDERAQLNALAKERKKRKELEVFVGGLDRDAVEEDVKKVFQHVGEVIDVRMNKELSTNKNKGYAFVKFATKEQVTRALAEMRNPVIRGKRCGTAPSEDNDTLFLGNICNTWTKEAVRQKLKDYGVEGVESITLVADPKHEGLSRGFAFLEFPCHADAMTAYKRLQRPDVVFGHFERTAKVAFAEPLRDPDPEVMAQVKSVFIDGLPPYWDEDRVREKFKCFGGIARITLARNMSTAKRKDFGFVDFSTHEAAVACVEGINNTELGDGNLKAKVRVRLSNPLPKTQAVKGGMCGGFRISRGPMGRGFSRGGPTSGRGNFPRGRGFHPRGPGPGGRIGFAAHEFGSPYPPFRGRSNFGRGGRWNSNAAHPVPGEGPIFPDRMRHGDRGHADDAFFRRQQFPMEGPRPFMGRHFGDRHFYDNTDHGLKRPFSMTEPDPDYLGPSRRPRFSHPDSASSLPGDRFRDNFPPGGDQYTRDYYGSDYGRGQYPPFYRGDRPYGRGYGRGYF